MEAVEQKRILIIDDDPVIREILSEILEMNGYIVDTAGDGDKGIDKHCRQPFDLVITDIIMPGKEGIETIYELRHASPDLKIIAISGGGHLESDGYLRMAGKLGANLTLDKPFETIEIEVAVKKLLSQNCS